MSDIALDLFLQHPPFFPDRHRAVYRDDLPLELSDKVNDLLRLIVVTLILLQVAVWGSRLITIFDRQSHRPSGRPPGQFNPEPVGFLCPGGPLDVGYPGYPR